MLRNRNYLFLAPAPAPPLSIISVLASTPAPAPAPAPAIYRQLKLYYNNSTIRNMSQWRCFFILQTDWLEEIFIKTIISAPAPALAPGLKYFRLHRLRHRLRLRNTAFSNLFCNCYAYLYKEYCCYCTVHTVSAKNIAPGEKKMSYKNHSNFFPK